MTFSFPSWQRVLRHGIVWLLVLALFTVIYYKVPSTKHEGIGEVLLSLALMAVPIYTHFWLLTNLLERGRTGRYLAATVATILGSALALDAADQAIQVIVVSNKAAKHYSLSEFANTTVGVVMVLLLSTGVRYVRRGIISHFQMQQLRALQLETELSLLKAQVNQHFLFNTLNNLYGLSLAAPDQMPEALLQLAGLMRYQLDSSRQSTVTVGTEAEYLANYIGLEKLRLRSNTEVEFTTDLPHPDRPLAPLLLLPLVENCFKHAIGPSGENTIRIHLTQTDTSLTLRTDNSIPPHYRPVPSGLGLPTLRTRLAQFYPGNLHRLTLDATPAHYTATLMLIL
jgi:signal transduction histidine kinase